MISRLVAARAAIVMQSDAAAQELDREFRGSTFAEVAKSLGGGSYALTGAWEETFNGAVFLDLLFGPSGTKVLSDIRQQNELFTRHLMEVIGSAKRIILCDTGLYGSTQRLLAQGFPDLRIETIQFARSNYKGHGEEHFPRVTGLIVQQSDYSPLNPSSSVLRYWHLIESLFEPNIPSVKSFVLDEFGQIVETADRYNSAPLIRLPKIRFLPARSITSMACPGTTPGVWHWATPRERGLVLNER